MTLGLDLRGVQGLGTGVFIGFSSEGFCLLLRLNVFGHWAFLRRLPYGEAGKREMGFPLDQEAPES